MGSNMELVLGHFFRGLINDLDRFHPSEAEHLRQVVDEGSLAESMLDQNSKLWGAIPLEILEQSQQGKAYLTLMDTFLEDNKSVTVKHATEPPQGVPELSTEQTQFIEKIFDMFPASQDPMALLSDPSKLAELVAQVEAKCKDGTLDVERLEAECKLLTGLDPSTLSVDGDIPQLLSSLGLD